MQNTGYKSFETLEKYFTDDGTSTGETKPNIVTDPDYIAPVKDFAECPPTERYYNTVQTKTVKKNDCGTGYIGSQVQLTAYANQFVSNVSLADANNKAIAWLDEHVQSYANIKGTCTAGYEPNTFIGGIANTINTPALIAEKLGLPVSKIQSFRVIGDNIEFAINENYIVPQSAFHTNSDITYYNDANGFVTALYPNTFGGTSKFTWCNFPKLLILEGNGSGGGPFNHSAIIDINLPECLTLIGGHHFDSCYSLKTVNMPKLTNMGVGGYYIFSNCTALNSIYAPLCTQMGATTDNDRVFQDIKPGCVITINSALQTNNGNLPDGDLQYAINSRSAIVNYIS